MVRSANKRQTTIYFPPDLLKRTKIYGITVERELSDIVVQATREYLDRVKAPPAPVDEPEAKPKGKR